ncbi:tyrosine-protein kinase receptor Tie-1 isoform X1 [Hippoglossus hippoglossus]|uniref:tyrosine-protein kinase receptor Tie-1 isoform X1 n=2 Tax=Hippoglossus hippoglossus TaxID=8267 RepID=UPI00148D2E72|nr:tyrosine-protein kinase receptor Tie-1 isoform X1 [Hippoglossus hippoglossus]XP_035032697.2 tyrosine-protein kinase receptor Tie-1 isoform X1 [Hippoglossus stenolepis]
MRILYVFVLCFINVSNAVIDLTMISTAEFTNVNHFTISCINGGNGPAQVEMSIKRDNEILKFPKTPKFNVHKPRNTEITAREFRELDHIGIFYCESTQEDPLRETVTMINNYVGANFIPTHLTLTANKGATVNLSMELLSSQKRDVTWKYNGNYYYMTHWNDMINRTAVLTVEDAAFANQGIYSASYVGDSPLHGAWMRLIVRDCPAKRWGPDCDKACPECLNGGECHDMDGDCICPPGFMGMRCETACREGMFGRNCQESCGAELNCKGLRFCLPDPYGCSCASGWFGIRCEKPCHNDMYGPDCRLSCKCQNGGVCNRFSGCQCPRGWRGPNCERSDRAPQILGLETNLEWNLNSSPKIHCSATGNPLPSHNGIELRKLDSSVLKASHTIMDSNKSIALFEIPRLSAQQGGMWECRVSTNGGQDSHKFSVTIKEPPVPIAAPKLLEKSSKQLVVMPVDAHRGDGPIISTRLLYKPVENGDSWSSIIVYSEKEPITLMNLEPSTRYRVCVQLTRPGEGGEGEPGPEAIMETDCPEPTVQPEIDISSVEGRNVTVRWRLPGSGGVNAGAASGFLVQLFGPPPYSEKPLDGTTLLNVLSTKFHSLEYQQDYTVVVRLINCGSRGPPSKPYRFRISSQGPSSPRNVQALPLSVSAVQVKWQPPEDPNGGIIKYIIEYQPLGQGSHHPWVDTDDGNKTTKDVTALNGSTVYQFRVRAFSKVPGEWSKFVQATTQGDGLQSLIPTTQGVAGRAVGDNYQLMVAVVGSVTVTCVTILLALLALFFIRKTLLNRRRTFTYQSGSGEETILQFNSGTLTLTRRPKPTPEPLTYPILEWEDIKFEDVIGEGNFGQVIKAMIKKDGSKMSAAIKMLKEFASENDHRDFAGELEVLCKLGQHPNIINLIGACENRGYLYIAIEYAPYGNLLDFLRKSRVLETDPAFAKEHGTASTLTSQQLLQFAVDVATGMHYLSDKQFIHRDLAARNVLVGDNLVAKIADFGLSRGEEVYVKKTMEEMMEVVFVFQGRLPVRWMAIESLNYSVYTTKSDVWSFGVLLWEIVSLGGTPYCGMTCAELYEKLPQGYRMEKPKNCDDEIYELMRQCWRDRPYERPPFSQISVQLNRMQEARKAYVNMALFENFTYAGIDATAEEA